MQSDLFTEVSVEQQEVVVGGLRISVKDYANFTKAFGGISQGAKANAKGATTYGTTAAEYINANSSKDSYLNTTDYGWF